MIFITESGSTYELDTPNKRLRRLDGEHNPTPRMGADGEWRQYEDITDVEIGCRLFVQWFATPETPPNVLPLTITTPVVAVFAGLN